MNNSVSRNMYHVSRNTQHEAVMTQPTAELAILYEISSLAFSASEEDFAEEAMEKATRLFGVRHFVLLLGSSEHRRLAVSWGFRHVEDIAKKMGRNEPNQFYSAFGDGGELGALFMEQAHSVTDKERRLYTIFARRLEDVLLARHLEKQRVEMERVETLFNSIPDPVVVVDKDNRILAASHTWYELSGSDEEKVIGRRLQDIGALTRQARRTLGQCSRKWREEDYSRLPIAIQPVHSGETRHFEMNPAPTTYGAEEVMILTFRDVTERVRAEEALRERVREVGALFEVSQEISSRLDLDVILDKVIETSVEVIRPAEKGTLHLLNGESNKLVVRSSVGFSQEVVEAACFKPDEGYTGWVFTHREPLVMRNVKSDPRTKYIALPEVQEEKSALCVPLIVKGRAIGTISLDNTSALEAFSEDDQRLLMTLANQAAIAIENARLYQETERRAAQAALIYEVGQRVSGELGLDIVLFEVVTAVHDAFGYYNVLLLLPDEEGEWLTLQAIVGGYAGVFPPDLRLAMGEGMIGHAATSGETQVSGDVSKNPHYVRKAAEKTNSELAVPIKSGQRVIGVLDMQSDELGAFDEIDVAAMETLSTQIATAIENARLYEQAQQEIAERVRVEEALRKSEEKYRVISENTGDFIAVVGLDGKYTYMSPSHRRLGYEPEELVGKSGFDFLHPDDRRCMYSLMLEYGSMRVKRLFAGRYESITRSLDFRFAAKSGEWRDLESTASLIMDESGKPASFLLVSRDVTERKRDEEAQKRFISNVSHELRTPVHNIRSSITLLGKYEPALLPADQRERLLAAIDSESKRLGELIEDILTLSRLDRGTTVLRRKETDLNPLLCQAGDRLQSALGRWGGTVRQALATQPILVEIDPSLMLQVAVNLLDNAIKYSPAGGQITLRSGQGETDAWFSVRDEGVGMAGEQMERIFERFYRVTTAHETPGTGIGLGIAKEIVELHGGRIELQSESGKGSCFTVYLPVSA